MQPWAIISLILAIIVGIVGTIVSFILIVPDKRRNSLPGFLRFLHDLFNFKFLTIEKIMQAFYIFSTIYVVVFGFFNIFSFTEVYVSYTKTQLQWTGWAGFLIMIFGPVVVRIAYELLMMFIILVKNTNQINNKLGTSYAEKKPQAPVQSAPVAPVQSSPVAPVQPAVAPAPVQPDGWFCTQCGHKNAEGSMFCNNCGKSK